MGMPHTRTAARTAALFYVGSVAVAGFVHGLRGAPDDATIVVMQCLTLPGHLVVLLLLLAGAGVFGAAGTGADAGADIAPAPFDPMIVHTAAALVNVLVLWGLCVFARRVRVELREAREWRAARGGSTRREGRRRA
ncbi:hypothetical protein [Streptomyces wuyuanensis]|uniref:hypothetical protein n=1 Tax=Streptomyces wuyuanensis TaxID=1196353 RepID=UPI0037B6AC96